MEVSATTINSGDMAGVTLAAIKELSTENEALKENVSGQLSVVSGQQAAISSQQKQIATLLRANAALNTRLRSVENRLPKKRGSARRHR